MFCPNLEAATFVKIQTWNCANYSGKEAQFVVAYKWVKDNLFHKTLPNLLNDGTIEFKKRKFQI